MVRWGTVPRLTKPASHFTSLRLRLHYVKWLAKWRLAINASKSSEISITGRRQRKETLNITINDEKVSVVQSMKYLGVWIDSKLKFDDWNI